MLAVDEEVRALSDGLEVGSSVLELTAAGIAGSCSQCAAIMPLDARYCASCGAPAQVALGTGTVEPSIPLEAPEPAAETPPLPPQQDEQPEEIPTEERAALEAGNFEEADPGGPVGEVPLDRLETFVEEPAPWLDEPAPALDEPAPPSAEEAPAESRGWLKRRRGA